MNHIARILVIYFSLVLIIVRVSSFIFNTKPVSLETRSKESSTIQMVASTTVILTKDDKNTSRKKQNKLTFNAKQSPVEQNPVKISKVPTLSEIDETIRAKGIQKDVFTRSGGYPNDHVRNSVYLYLWSNARLQVEKNKPVLSLPKVTREKELLDDLVAFGLL